MALDLTRYVDDVATRDGRTVRVRPIRADDLDAMMAMWSRLSMDTIRLRFFAPRRMDREQMRHFTELDYEDRFALVAARGEDIVGVARFDRLPDDPSAAEFAVLVEDAEQGQGIGTTLLRRLLEPAQDLEITQFKGSFLLDNRRMRKVLADAGLEPVFTSADGTIETSFRAVPSDSFLRSADEDDRNAAIRALAAVLRPGAVAVVGASRDEATAGGRIFANLLGRFEGPVYPVTTERAQVAGVTTYPAVEDCPQVPDLAIVCVAPPEVPDAVAEAAAAGVTAAVVITPDVGDAGDTAQAIELLDPARARGIRIVGPGSMGVLNAADDVRLNGTLSTATPFPGGAAFLSQSGALGLAALSRASRHGVGLSSFVSVGSKADISGNDLLQYWGSDDGTSVILLYLESFGNPEKFGRIARRVARSTPVVAVKAGRTSAGRRLTASVPGQGVADDDVTVDALFAQTGVIRTRTLAELFDVAAVLEMTPPPQGRRVGIVTNGRGPGVLAADALDAAGLHLCDLSNDTRDRLCELLPDADAVTNPVDVGESVAADVYGQALRVVAADPDVDAVLTIFVPVLTDAAGINDAITEARAQIDEDTPVLCVSMTADDEQAQLRRARIPVFDFPEDAARALGHVVQYGEWCQRPAGHIVEVTDIDTDAARAVVDDALRNDDVMLPDEQAAKLLEALCIHVDDDAPDGVRMVIGVRRDPLFGAVMMVGVGDDLDDAPDIGLRLLPVTNHDVDDMLRELRDLPLAIDADQTLDVDALRMLLFRVSALLDIADEVDVLDLRPVVVHADGVTVCGASVGIADRDSR